MGSTSLVGQRNLIIVTITGDTRIGPRTLCTALSCGLKAGVELSEQSCREIRRKASQPHQLP
jgi:hypothetical protein